MAERLAQWPRDGGSAARAGTLVARRVTWSKGIRYGQQKISAAKNGVEPGGQTIQLRCVRHQPNPRKGGGQCEAQIAQPAMDGIQSCLHNDHAQTDGRSNGKQRRDRPVHYGIRTRAIDDREKEDPQHAQNGHYCQPARSSAQSHRAIAIILRPPESSAHPDGTGQLLAYRDLRNIVAHGV